MKTKASAVKFWVEADARIVVWLIAAVFIGTIAMYAITEIAGLGASFERAGYFFSGMLTAGAIILILMLILRTIYFLMGMILIKYSELQESKGNTETAKVAIAALTGYYPECSEEAEDQNYDSPVK